MRGVPTILFEAVCTATFDGAKITVGQSYGVIRVAQTLDEPFERWYLLARADDGKPGSYHERCFAPADVASDLAMVA